MIVLSVPFPPLLALVVHDFLVLLGNLDAFGVLDDLKS